MHPCAAPKLGLLALIAGALLTASSVCRFILQNCERLALSTNQIDRMMPLTGMDKLRLLSLSRNAIKRIERLEDVADTLEELWLSYNQISALDGLAGCVRVLLVTVHHACELYLMCAVACRCNKLRTLYLSNNKIADWAELDKLAGLPELKEVLFVGNPIYDGLDKTAQRINVIKRIPNVAKIDNEMVAPHERDAAQA